MNQLKSVSNPDAGIENVLQSWYDEAKNIINVSTVWRLGLPAYPEHWMHYIKADVSNLQTGRYLKCVSNVESALVAGLQGWYENAKFIVGLTAATPTPATDPTLWMFYIEEPSSSPKPKGYLKCASCVDTNCDATIAGWYENPDLKAIVDIVSVFHITGIGDAVHYFFYISEPSSNCNINQPKTLKRGIYTDDATGLADFKALGESDKKIIKINPLFGDSPPPFLDNFIFYLE
jgi:hypothetical protein